MTFKCLFFYKPAKSFYDNYNDYNFQASQRLIYHNTVSQYILYQTPTNNSIYYFLEV